MNWKPPVSYKPRKTRFREIRQHGDWRFKLYTVSWDGREVDLPVYDDGLRQMNALLPSPAITERRPGVGIIIFHQGQGMHYLVLLWWDIYNELANRVWVRPATSDSSWRPANEESFCVWDLETIWFERNAYVETVLSGREGDMVGEYLKLTYSN